jgi:DNA-binding SARP family transcriptional activator/PAS domain-containing protein
MEPIKRIERRDQPASRAEDPVTKDGELDLAQGGGPRVREVTARRPRTTPPLERELGGTVLARDVLESLPYGVVIVDDRGRVLAFNRLLHELLGVNVGRIPSTCCEMFGCRQPGTALEGGCLTEFAQAGNGRLSEMRLELPWGGSVGTVRVSGWPLAGSVRFMFHVRPGERRSEQPAPRIALGGHLRVYTLGRFKLESGQGSLAGPWLAQRPGRLLKLLVAERRRVVSVDEIADALWPDRGFQALGFVRHFVHVLRNQLEPGRARGESSFIMVRRGGYALDRRSVRVDADEFERRVETAELALATGDQTGALGRLEEGLKLYGGEFLADEPYAEWALAERNRLRDGAERTLRMISDIKQSENDLDGSAAALCRLADSRPFDSDVQRDLIVLHIKRGRRTEAMRRYGELRKRLQREFGEEPDFQLADLAG